MTLAEIRTKARGLVDDDPDTPVSYTDADLDAAINEGLALFAIFTLCLESRFTLNLTTARSYRASDTRGDYLAPLRVLSNGSKVRPCRLQDLDALDQNWRSTTGPAPSRYAALGWDLLLPYPASTGAVDVLCAIAAPKLVADGDVPAIPALYHPVLADYGVYRVLAPQGGSLLAKSLPYLERWREAVSAVSAAVRARGQTLGYDTLPPELKRQRERTRKKKEVAQ